MRNMLAFIAGAVITVGAVGFYLDWFNLRSTPSSNGHKSYTLDVDTAKISDDVHKAEQKVEQRLAEKAEKAEKSKKDAVTPESLKMPPARN